MKAHQIDPYRLAELLDGDVPPEEYVADMREYPEIYFVDHLQACRDQGVLPLSEVAWRRACRTC